MYASLCKALDITINCQHENGSSQEIVLKKCVITVCQNYFQKQCLDEIETVSVEHEQNQRIKRQTIGCVKYVPELKCQINIHLKIWYI